VLIVGDGATGRQIAAELAATHRVLLATGRPRKVSPDRVAGRSVFWWLDRLGLLRAPRDSLRGRLLRERDPFPGRHLELGRLGLAGVAIKPRVASLDEDRVTFADGSDERIAVVVWATGYRDDTSWLAVDGSLDERGRVIESEGISPIEGLYHVGRNWQRNRGSALLLGVGEDARLIVERIVQRTAQPLAGPATAVLTA
jgi:putative flavoprotein involved in K+ transport